MQATRALAERLYSRLVRQPNGCLEYSCARSSAGYGAIGVGSDVVMSTHRLAWELAYGPIPDGMFVCHRCDNPPCCDIEHLFLGTPSDNMRDKAAKGRHHEQSKTHCKQGHAFDEANTRWGRRGTRECRACERARIPARVEATRARRALARVTKADPRVQQ